MRWLQPRSLPPQLCRNSSQPCRAQQEFGRSALRLRELYMSTVHHATERVRWGLLLSSLAFYRQTGHGSFPHVPLVPACRSFSSALGIWRKVTMPACAPACTPNDHAAPQHTSSPWASHHLHAGGLRLLELYGLALPCGALGTCSPWRYIVPCVIKRIFRFTL